MLASLHPRKSQEPGAVQKEKGCWGSNHCPNVVLTESSGIK